LDKFDNLIIKFLSFAKELVSLSAGHCCHVSVTKYLRNILQYYVYIFADSFMLALIGR